MKGVKIIKGMDNIIKDCFYLTVVAEEGIHISCSRNIANSTLGNLLSVIKLSINRILYLKIVLM